MVKTTLKIEGMMCEVCESKVISALESIPGVTSVTANYKKGTATVISENKIEDNILNMAILDIGFKSKVKHGLF